MRAAQEREPTGPKINDAIRAEQVRLIDQNGTNVGVVPFQDALNLSVAAGLDLVEISPDAQPPVCKIMDFGKYKYQEQKKAAEARKKQKTVEIKEIKMRPNIDDHDYDVKMRSIRRFFEEGDKVKVTLRFRGREMAHPELGRDLLDASQDRHRADRQGGGRAPLRGATDDHGALAALTQAPPTGPAQRRALCGWDEVLQSGF